jgi:hypothetical protein
MPAPVSRGRPPGSIRMSSGFVDGGKCLEHGDPDGNDLTRAERGAPGQEPGQARGAGDRVADHGDPVDRRRGIANRDQMRVRNPDQFPSFQQGPVSNLPVDGQPEHPHDDGSPRQVPAVPVVAGAGVLQPVLHDDARHGLGGVACDPGHARTVGGAEHDRRGPRASCG